MHLYTPQPLVLGNFGKDGHPTEWGVPKMCVPQSLDGLFHGTSIYKLMLARGTPTI